MTTAICTQIKNSRRYIKEFVDHHLALGIDKVCLFEDYGSDSHKDIFKGYDKVEIKSLAEYGIPKATKTAGSQLELQQKFCRTEPYDWVLCIDDDEYLNFQEGYDLEKFLSEFADYKGVWLGWRPLNANGHIKRPKGSLKENYTREAPVPIDGGQYTNKKSFVNMNQKGNFTWTHHCVDGGVNTDFTTNYNSYPIHDKAYLDHYFTKSLEDWMDRLVFRGNMMNANRNMDKFFQQNPDLIKHEDEVVEFIRWNYNLPDITWISKKKKIISGGNVKRLAELKDKYLNNKYHG